MRFILGAIMLFALGIPLSAATPDYREQFRELVRKGAEQSREYWKDDHFGDAPWTADTRVLKGRSSHDCTMMYWNFMDAKLNGNRQSLDRALTHYQAMNEHFWNPEKKRYNTGYDFLMNTSIALTLALSLRDASDVIPPEVQKDMRTRLAGIAAYLPTYTTALTNNADLRANNQDSFASFALALIATENKAPAIRREALKKFRQVLTKVQQSFWIEGGVDVGYQSVGEAAFADAADLLWDDLTREEKKKVADLALNNLIGNGFGLENARSPSWIKSGGGAFSSGLLGRVPNEAVAADAVELFSRTRESGFPTHWWLHDPASLSFFSGFWKNADAVAALAPRPLRFSCGSLACQIMERDENEGWHNGMEKAYLTGDGNGATAIFGDYSRFNPAQAKKKFGADQPPFTPNPGGLRYLGYNNHLYVIADDRLGMPRLDSADSFRYPQLYDRSLIPGPAASEYLLTQVLPGMNGAAPVRVEQTFAVAGNVLIAVFSSPDSLGGLSYGLTMPAEKAAVGKGTALVTQSALGGKGKRTLALTGSGIEFQFDSDRRQPYFKDEITLNGTKIKLPQLRRIIGTFTAKSDAVLVLSPENRAADIRCSTESGAVRVSFRLGDRRYDGACATAPAAELKLGGFTVKNPKPGFLQLIITGKDGALEGFAACASALADNAGPLFTAADGAAAVSMLRTDRAALIEITGKAALSDRFGKRGTSWVDGRAVTFPGEAGNDRIKLGR